MILMLDNNVILDFLMRREPFFELANKVFMLGVFEDSENYISVPMLTDIYYLLQKDYGSQEAQSMIENNLSCLNLVGSTADDALWCLRQRWNDYEDCLVARCAENIKADYIVTRDKGGFKKSIVPGITPKELIKLFEARGIQHHEVVLSKQ